MDNRQRENSSLDHVHVNSWKDDAMPNSMFVCLFIQRVFNFMIEMWMRDEKGIKHKLSMFMFIADLLFELVMHNA